MLLVSIPPLAKSANLSAALTLTMCSRTRDGQELLALCAGVSWDLTGGPYIFQPKELVAAVFPHGTRIVQQLLDWCQVELRLFLLVSGGRSAVGFGDTLDGQWLARDRFHMAGRAEKGAEVRGGLHGVAVSSGLV